MDVDGLDPEWQEGVESEWERDLENHSSIQDIVQQHNLVPQAVVRLMSPAAMRGSYDASDGTQLVEQDDGQRRGDGDVGGVQIVKDLSLPYFRAKLIEHFDIAFQKNNEIIWPGKRNRIHFPPMI